MTENAEKSQMMQGKAKLDGINELLHQLDVRFHELDGTTLSDATLNSLSAVKEALTRAVSAVSVDKAHLDIKRADQVIARAQEFIASLADPQVYREPDGHD